MDRYIQQLIEDIHRATYHVRPPHELWLTSEADPQDELELEDMSHVEKYLYGEEEPISSITGIDSHALPPGEKLTMEQKELLSSELERLLDYFHFELEFPKDYPVHLRYPFIKDFWTQSHVPLSFGTNLIELCDFNPEGCPFTGYCTTCEELQAQIKHDEEIEGASGMDMDMDFDIHDLLPTPEDIKRWVKNWDEIDSEEDDSEEDNLTLPFGNLENEDEDSYEVDEEVDEDDYDFIHLLNGFYNDDGTRVDPGSVPIPGLCIICKKYQKDNGDENIFCNIYRINQRDSDNFECEAFEKM